MPWDDDEGDDAPAFATPLPPDDRLWRHPSELRGLGVDPGRDGGHRRPPRPWSLAIVSGLVGAVLTVGVVAVVGNLTGTATEPPVAVERVAAQPSVTLAASTGSEGTAAAVRAAAPAVVRVDVQRDDGSANGSGVVFRDDGYLLTSAHLLDGARSVRVVLADGTPLDAAVVGVDPWTDLGVVKVDRLGMVAAVVDGDGGTQVGQPAVAVAAAQDGQPWQRSALVTALARRVVGVDGSTLHGLLQIGTGIEPIASGGALVDAAGVVIGVLTQVATDAQTGLAYAVPADVALTVAEQLAATGRPRHVWLGIEGDDLSPSDASSMKVSGGVELSAVVDSSPAALAGLAPGDVITSVDGKPVSTMSELVVALRAHQPGDQVQLGYVRSDGAHRCTAVLGEQA